jgi:hypothetical protein
MLAFTAVLAITRLFRFAGWLAAMVSIITYLLTQLGIKGATLAIIFPILVNVVTQLVTAWLGTLTSSEIRRTQRQIGNDSRMIQELRLYDPTTGLLRYQYALQTLKREINRSQRNEELELSGQLCQPGRDRSHP